MLWSSADRHPRSRKHARHTHARTHTSWLTAVGSGGSRISQIGAPAPKVGAPTYYLAKLFLKTLWKWEKLDPEGGCASLVPSPAPLLRSANGGVPRHYWRWISSYRIRLGSWVRLVFHWVGQVFHLHNVLTWISIPSLWVVESDWYSISMSLLNQIGIPISLSLLSFTGIPISMSCWVGLVFHLCELLSWTGILFLWVWVGLVFCVSEFVELDWYSVSMSFLSFTGIPISMSLLSWTGIIPSLRVCWVGLVFCFYEFG